MSKEQTYGQKLVSLNFNPSGENIVDVTKQAHANIVDSLQAVVENSEDPMQVEIAKAAIQDQLRAQMMAVKAFTWGAK
jgi:predicted aminopeptidase